MKFRNFFPYVLIIFILSFLLFPGLGNVHLFDWDEINFAEAAREMIISGNYSTVQIDFQRFWEKPPLFFWLQALSMLAFGITDFAARFPNAILGVIVSLAIYGFGSRIKDKLFALIWLFTFTGCILPYFYFRTGIIDPYFNFFIYIAIIIIAYSYSLKNYSNINLKLSKIKQYLLFFTAGISVGLALLTKGPVSLLLVVATWGIYWLIQTWNEYKQVSSPCNIILFYFKNIPFSQAFILLIGVFITSSPWFLLDLIKNGPWFLSEFLTYQVRLLTTSDAGHAGPFYFHAIAILFGCFPASIFAYEIFTSKSLRIKSTQEKTLQKQFLQELINFSYILFFVVLIIFSIVKTKIIHYSSLCYFPFSFLAALYIYNMIKSNLPLSVVSKVLFWLIGSTFSLALFLLPLIAWHPEWIAPYIKDEVAQKALLSSPVYWSGFEALIGLFLFIILVISFILIKKNKRYLIGFSLAPVLALYFASFYIIPKVERYAQGQVIDIYTQLAGKKCSVEVLGFKSFANIYYTNTYPNSLKQQIGREKYREHLISENIEYSAIFVAKIKWVKQNTDLLLDYKNQFNIEKLGEKGGFVFFSRRANTLQNVYNPQLTEYENIVKNALLNDK